LPNKQPLKLLHKARCLNSGSSFSRTAQVNISRQTSPAATRHKQNNLFSVVKGITWVNSGKLHAPKKIMRYPHFPACCVKRPKQIVGIEETNLTFDKELWTAILAPDPRFLTGKQSVKTRERIACFYVHYQLVIVYNFIQIFLMATPLAIPLNP